MLVKAGSGLAGEVAADSAGVSNAQETLVAPLDDEAAVEAIFQARGAEIAGVILEPLPANYGLIIQRKEFILKVMELAKQAGALVIFDEVISGFRVHPEGMAGVLGLVTFGKIVVGGFHFGAFGGRRDLMDFVAPQGPVYQAGTLSANPVSVTAGITTLKKVERENVIEKTNQKTESFARAVNAKFSEAGFPWQVVTFGSLFWVHPKTDRPIRRLSDIPAVHREGFPKFFHAALELGVYLAPSSFEVGFISYAHTEEILKLAVERLGQAAQKALA